MAAVKSGKHIYINGTGNTLASVASDINDPLYCTWNSVTKVFTMFGRSGNIRYLKIRKGGTLDVTDGETLVLHCKVNNATRFYVDAGGTFNMSGNSLLEGRPTGAAQPYYWYWYGAVNIIGDGVNNPIIQGYRRIYLYETSNSALGYTNDIVHLENMTVGSNGYGANNYCFYLYTIGKLRPHIFKNIVLDDRIGRNYDTYMFNFYYGANKGAERMTFEGISYKMGERCFHNVGGWCVHLTNNTYDGGSASWAVLHYSASNTRARKHKITSSTYNNRSYGQYFPFHDGDTWTATGKNTNGCLVNYGAEVLFRNCTWLEVSGDAIETKYQGRALVWTGNVFSDTSTKWYDVEKGGEISFVHGCGVTVYDEHGVPIDNATVYFQQLEEKEEFYFTTKSNGKLRAIHGLEVALLTYQSRYGNLVGDIENWSDGVGDRKHRVTVSIDGYKTQSQDVVMNQERELVFRLETDTEDFSQSNIIKL